MDLSHHGFDSALGWDVKVVRPGACVFGLGHGFVRIVHRSLLLVSEEIVLHVGLLLVRLPLCEKRLFGMFLFDGNIVEREHKLLCKRKASVCVLFFTGGCDSL